MQVETKAATVHSLQKPIKKFNVNTSAPFTYYEEGGVM